MPSQSTHPSRVAGIDAGRALATLGIVWVHTSEIQGLSASYAALGRFGTSFYIIGAVLMSARPFFFGRTPSALRVIRKRATRLLVPFLLWSLVYAGFYLLSMLPQGYDLADITLYWGPLAGTAPHLWFLPFAFVAGVLTALTMPYLLRLRVRILCLGLVVGFVAAACLSYALWLPELDRPALTRLRLVRLGRWVEEWPLLVAAVFGVAAYGRSMSSLEKLGRRRRRQLATAALVAWGVTQTAYFFWLEPLQRVFWTEVRLFANLAGALWLVACIAERRSVLIRRIAPLGRATYFAFLCHQLVLDLCKRSLSQLPGHGTLAFAVLSTLAIFGISATLGWYAPRVRALRWLVP